MEEQTGTPITTEQTSDHTEQTADHTVDDLSTLPGFQRLSPERQEQLRVMAENMRERDLPAPLSASGLRSTAALLLEQQEEATPRIATDPVRQFIAENSGTPVVHTSRAVPRKETKQRMRERLHEQLVQLVRTAHKATRRHEILRVRREMLGLDQGYIRRTLGTEGDALCNEINAWLIDAATKLNQG